MEHIIKRDGSKVLFDAGKIKTAVSKAFGELNISDTDDIAIKIAQEILEMTNENNTISVEDIQNLVEEKLMESDYKDVARAYVRYRYKREMARDFNTTDETILEIIESKNDFYLGENSNKNPKLNTTIRDYIAGETSKDITKRLLLPKDIVEAHEKGIIHFHDSDYYVQKMYNCCLINLKDMLENGTAISDTMIESPHIISTCGTITTQIIAQVASSQYGGQTISLAHLAPFVSKTREYFRKEVYNEFIENGIEIDYDKINRIAEKRVKKDIEKCIQTIQYQLITIMTTNGQAPFLTIFMYLNEVDDSMKDDLAMLIEEMIKQTRLGVKNREGVYITPSFPKLIYVLEEDNIYPESKYYYLTELCAKSSLERMAPDYISEKVMKELKEGNVFSSMGCVEGNEIITYKFDNKLHIESFRRMWNRLSEYYTIKRQCPETDMHLYLDVDKRVKIYDTEKGFVDVKRVIRNTSSDWLKVKIQNGRSLLCTSDHPFHTQRGRIYAKDLLLTDIININPHQYSEENYVFDTDKAWLLGMLLCDSSYDGTVVISIALESENDIEIAYKERMKKCFNATIDTIERHRGKKGDYKDLVVKGNQVELVEYLNSKFKGKAKIRRQIPTEVFEWDYNSKLAFMAGMIDADGYINPTTNGGSIVQLGSTNKELALQQMALAQALDMPAKMYENHYSSKNKNAIRYRVEFNPSENLLSFIISEKKRNNFVEGNGMVTHYTGKVVSLEVIKNYTDFSYDVTTESDHFEVSGIYSHNCRSFLSPYYDENGKPKFYGRFNQGVVTINLPHVALSAKAENRPFYEVLDERLELCHKALRCRHERLKGTVTDVAPILWQDGAIARLKQGEKIDKLLYGGYSTISLGYAGLYECVKAYTGLNIYDEAEGEKFGLEIMQYLNDKCDKWKEKENIGYSPYGTPIEATSEKFAKALKRDFGENVFVSIDNKDRNYITNSCHVPVFVPMDAFSKLEIEAKFQRLSLGGVISYVELPSLTNNLSIMMILLKFMYDTTLYAETNTKSDYCACCGYDKEISMIDENNKLIWECPNCKNRDTNTLYISRRTCGYKGTAKNGWNQGRMGDIHDRVLHIDDFIDE